MTDGIAPCSTSNWAVRTLIELTIATAAMVEPGPTGVSRPSTVIRASACGVHRSMTRSASSRSRLPTAGTGSSDIDCSTEVTAITRSPRRRAPRANSTGTAERPPAENTITRSSGPNVKLERITSARPGVRSMNIAWRWPFAPTTCVWNVIDNSTIGLNPGYEPYRGNISSTGIREWPVPNRWTSPSRPIAWAHHELARSIASACVSAIRSRIPVAARIQASAGVAAAVTPISTHPRQWPPRRAAFGRPFERGSHR